VYPEQDRRKQDPIQDKIEELIMSSTDPKDKAFLLILNRMSDNLQENTELTRKLGEELSSHTKSFIEHTNRFSKHEQEELALINQGRGGWKVAAISLIVIQGLFVWWVQLKLSELTQLRVDVNQYHLELELIKSRHAREDSLKEGP
jgi:hypothetical protein